MGATGQCQKGTATQSNSTGSGNTNSGNMNVNNSCAMSTGRCKAGNAHQTNDAGSNNGSSGGATVNPTGNTTMGNVNVNNSCMGSTGDCTGGDANQTNRAGNVGNQNLASSTTASPGTQTANPSMNGADNNYNTNNSCAGSSGHCYSGSATQDNEAGNVGSQTITGNPNSTSQTASPTSNQATNNSNTNNACMNSTNTCHAGNASQLDAAGNVGSQSAGGQGQGKVDPTQTASPSGNFANDQVNTNNGCMGSSIPCWSGAATEKSYAGNVGSQSISGNPSGTTSQTASPSGNGIAQNSNTNNACQNSGGGVRWYTDTCQGGSANQYNATGNVGSQSASGGKATQTASPMGSSIGHDQNTNNACQGAAASCQGGSANQNNLSGNVGSQSVDGGSSGSTAQTANPMTDSANSNANTNNACQRAGSNMMGTGQGCEGGSANQSNASGNVGSQSIGGGYGDPTQTASPHNNGADFNSNLNNACYQSSGYCEAGSANQQQAAGNVGSQSINGQGYSASQTASPAYNAANQNTNTNNACYQSSGNCEAGSANDRDIAGNVGEQSISGEGTGSNTQTANPQGNLALHGSNTNNACYQSAGSCEAEGNANHTVLSGNVGEQEISGGGRTNSQTANPSNNGPGQSFNTDNACYQSSGTCEAEGGTNQTITSGNVGEQSIQGSKGSANTQTASPSSNGPGYAANTNNACYQNSGTCEGGGAREVIASGNVGEQKITTGNGDPSSNSQTASPSNNGPNVATNTNNSCYGNSGQCEAEATRTFTVSHGNVSEDSFNAGDDEDRPTSRAA
jgi:hypothetical protein